MLSLSHEAASLAIAADTAANVDAPIAYYTITTSKGESKKVYSWRDLTLVISGLTSSTSYTFTVSATNADGTSPLSTTSQPVTTQVFIAPQPVTVQESSAPPAPSCANGGTACVVGDVGPGGGTVFYVATTPFYCGPTRSESCLYLEAAPALWNGGTRDPRRSWAKSPYSSQGVDNPSSPETATATAIGWGYRNTRAIILQGNTEAVTSAATLADSYALSVGGVIVDDWYLASKDELNQMCKWQRGLPWVSDETICTGGAMNTGLGANGFGGSYYWSSSHGQGAHLYGGSNDAWNQPMDPDRDDPGASYSVKDENYSVRPIRAFGTFAQSSAPSFALSKTAETIYARTTPIIGYTITSSGAPITSFSISPSVSAGLTFNTTTGILSGTPTETRTTTIYTITGSNSSGSATETFILRVAGSIGDLGPGGGTIYYVSSTPFACGPTRASFCTYLEVAPDEWQTIVNPDYFFGDPDPDRRWASVAYESATVGSSGSPETATATGIGWGYWNTRAIVLQGNTDTDFSAAALADFYVSEFDGIELEDWFLPSKDELDLIWEELGAGFLATDFYWSSSEKDLNEASDQWFQNGDQSDSEKSEPYRVRPVRAF